MAIDDAAFTGAARDPQTGLYNLRARLYDPGTGRFTQPDPIGYAGGPNLYAYAGNAPSFRTDHSGRGGPESEKETVATAQGGKATGGTQGGSLLGNYTQGTLPGMRVGGRTLPLLERLAAQAQRAVGPGSGTIYGTHVHTRFAQLVRSLRRGDLNSEVTYLNGKQVPYGTKGAVRLDVVEGPLTQPTFVYDLKTGSAGLDVARIAGIRSHLPPGSLSIPIVEITLP